MDFLKRIYKKCNLCRKSNIREETLTLKALKFDDLYPPEYYFEQMGVDSRIAIKCLNDARDTMGMARFSLSYISIENTDDLTKQFAKTIHLRHAIEDLNNSFDLLLQAPWMYYRAWEKFNNNGSLQSKSTKNKKDIIRNVDGWVHEAERECNYGKLCKYLNSESSALEASFNTFFKKYVSKEKAGKNFTVRSLCNTLKHNHSLQFEELYDPYDFYININGERKNLRECGLAIEFSQVFHDESSPGIELGKVKYSYSSDLNVDIEFTEGEQFRFKDCSPSTEMLKIKEVYKECCEYFDAIVELFENVYKEICSNMQLLPSFIGSNGEPNIKKATENMNLNDYFSIT